MSDAAALGLAPIGPPGHAPRQVSNHDLFNWLLGYVAHGDKSGVDVSGEAIIARKVVSNGGTG